MNEFINGHTSKWFDYDPNTTEIPEANPDILSDESSFIKKNELTGETLENYQAYQRLLSKGFLQTLAKREQQVWICITHHLNIDDTALCLGIKANAVRAYQSRVSKKLRAEILKERHISNEQTDTQR